MDKFDYIFDAGLYEVWLSEGNVGSKEDFKTWLNSGSAGSPGPKGVDGNPGIKGVDGRSSFQIFKSSKPSLVTDQKDYVIKLGEIFSRSDANVNTIYTSESVTGEVTNIVVPPLTATNPGGVIQVNPEDQNNLPKIGSIYLEVWDDAATNYAIKNLQSSVKGVGPFTFENVGGELNDPYYTTNSPFDIKPNGDIYVKSSALLSTYYKENVSQQSVNSAIIYFNIKDKYGRNSNAIPNVKNGFKAFGVVLQVKSATKIMLDSSSFRFDVIENAENGDWVGTIKGSAKSNFPLTYSLADPGPLQVNSSTGKITIANKSLIPSPSSSNRISSYELTITNGVKSKTVVFEVEFFKAIDMHVIDVAIAANGRSISKTINEKVAGYPGENTWFNSVSNNNGYARMIDFATIYTITKSNAAGENLGTYDGQYFGGLPVSIERLFPGDVPRNEGYQLSPYDKITKVVIYIGPNYHDATRLGWRLIPARINGQEGSDASTNPTKELVLTRPL